MFIYTYIYIYNIHIYTYIYTYIYIWVVVQSTLLTPRPNNFTRSLPPRDSRVPLRIAEGGALPCEGARHCPGFALQLQIRRTANSSGWDLRVELFLDIISSSCIIIIDSMVWCSVLSDECFVLSFRCAVSGVWGLRVWTWFTSYPALWVWGSGFYQLIINYLLSRTKDLGRTNPPQQRKDDCYGRVLLTCQQLPSYTTTLGDVWLWVGVSWAFSAFAVLLPVCVVTSRTFHPKIHEIVILGPRFREPDFVFGLIRPASGKSEITFLNQFSILFHKCGLRFSGFGAEDHVPP
jgi:hypothetical protein